MSLGFLILDLKHLYMATEIIPGLWIGDKNSAHNIDFINEKKIRNIINCSKNIKFSQYLNKNIEKIRIPVNDHPNKTYNIDNNHLYKHFNTITTFIHKKIQQQSNVLIHCREGVQRSPSIIVAYIMKYGKVNKNKAIYFVKSKREKCFIPDNNYDMALTMFEKFLYNLT